MAWALLLNNTKRDRQPVLDRGVNLHAVHEERAVAGDDDGAAVRRANAMPMPAPKL